MVWLDRERVDELQRIASYRHGRQTRSAVVREAVTWLLAREAAYLLRQRQRDREDADRLANDARRAAEVLRAQKDLRDRRTVVERALEVVRAEPRET
ncbi:MAG TPA: hypothetical protein VHZ31_08905 [Solirubrobacteraceae bacterium]|nr:hypothetical protein [Solirubrobacteraceae bacterium]